MENYSVSANEVAEETENQRVDSRKRMNGPRGSVQAEILPPFSAAKEEEGTETFESGVLDLRKPPRFTDLSLIGGGLSYNFIFSIRGFFLF